MNETGKVLIVTGAGRGIGAATAKAAAAAGWDVAVNYSRSKEPADAVVAAVQAAGRRAAAIKGDAGSARDIEAMFDAVEALLGRVGGVVINAGVTGDPRGPLADADPEMIARVVALNVTGAMLVAREAARRMSVSRGGKGGAIVTLSSVAAILGSPGDYVWYAATKGAIDSLTMGLARELGPEGVRVNAVSPGLIDTEIHAGDENRRRLAERVKTVPMGRAGTADEVADAVVFLLSDAARYVTGANLRVSGGR